MASSVSPTPPETKPSDLARPIPWKTIVWLAALVLILYAPVLTAMVREWIQHEDMGHGLFVVPVAAYIAWKERHKLLGVQFTPCWWALVLVFWGFFQLVLGILGADFFLARTAFLITLLGVIWTACGTAAVRVLAFPLFLLLFMIRLPLFIYSQVTFPLQLLASRIAEVSLSFIGIPVLRDGNILELTNQRLSVVEACSGIRSLLSLSFLSLVYAYFFDAKVWMRGVLLLATVPIAIIANASRVTLTGLLSEYKTELAQGIYHSFEGWVVFMVALAALISFHQVLNRICALFHARR